MECGPNRRLFSGDRQQSEFSQIPLRNSNENSPATDQAMNRRGVIIGLLAGLLGTASIAVAFVVYVQRLPDPDTADRRGLFRWMIETDLPEQPREIQATMLRRVEAELIAGIDFREVAAQINDEQRQILLRNADFLGRLWFRREAGRYLAEPAERRPIVLGQQIDEIRKLAIMDQLSALENWTASKSAAASGQGTQNPNPAGAIAALAAQSKRIERWLAEASPEDRPAMSQFFAALRDRLILDSFRRFGV